MTAKVAQPSDYVGRHGRRDCPYNGLQPYTEDDSDYFFGRDGDRDLVIANLMASRLTVLYGPSGVGKSSLLQAGVMPHLRSLDDESFSYVATDQAIVVYHAAWRDDPLADLAESLRAALPDGVDRDVVVPPGALSADLLRTTTHRLDADVYLLCDQFEEEILYQEGARADAFAAELGRIVSAAGLRVNVLLGVREDALAKLDHLEAYIPDLFSNSLRLDHLGVAAAREAIEQPLVRYRQEHPGDPMTIEPALVDRLLDELRTGRVSVTDNADPSVNGSASKTIETPFLQLVMTRLWSEEIARGSQTLSEGTLQSLGGAGRIVRTHLDSVMAHLSDEQRASAAHVFRYLVTPSGTKIAHTAGDLADYAGLSDSVPLSQMLEELASGKDRVLRPVPPPVDQPGPPRYEIFHDVMAPAVLDWRRRYVAEQDRLESEATLERARRDSEEQHRRTKRRLRRSRLLSAALALLLATAIAAIVYAKRSRDEAQASRISAEYQRLIDDSQQLLSSDPAAALHAALQAYDIRRGSKSEIAVRLAVDADNQVRVLRGHRGTVASSEFSPDGKSVVTAGWDGTARVFDASSGRDVHTLAPAVPTSSQLTQASFSPDGRLVATAARDGSVHVYTAADGRPVGALPTFKKPVAARWMERGGVQMLLVSSWGDELRPAVLWDPRESTPLSNYGDSNTGAFDATPNADGTLIVTAGYTSDRTAMRVTVWDGESGHALATSTSLNVAVFPHFAGPKSDRVALVGKNGHFWNLFLWDWRDSAIPVQMNGEARTPSDLAVSRDGERVAMVADKAVYVYDARAGAGDTGAIGYTAVQPDWIESADFSPDGQWLLTADDDGLSQIWRADKGNSRPLAQFAGHHGAVLSARFNPANPAQLTTAGTDKTARIWEFGGHSLLTSSGSWVDDAEFSKDGHHIVTAQDDGVYQVWDVTTRRMERRWQDDNTEPGSGRSAQFTPRGDAVVTATGYDYSPRLWDPRDGNSKLAFDKSDEFISSGAAVNAAGTRVAVGDYRNRVIQWDLSTGRIVSRSAASSVGSRIMAVSYIPNSDLIAAASSDGTVRIWDAAQLNRPPRAVLGSSGSSLAQALAPSPDGSQLAVVDNAHMISIWRVKGAQLIRQIVGPSTNVTSASFSSDGRLIAVAGADAVVHIWDGQSGQSVATLPVHTDMVNSVHFANDGTHLLTSSDDGTAALVTCDTCGPFQNVLSKAKALDGGS